MMKVARLAFLSGTLAVASGCGAGTLDLPVAPQSSAPVATATGIYACPDGDTTAECMDATPLGDQPTDPSVIAYNCPEACQELKRMLGMSGPANSGTALALQVNWDPYNNDAVLIRCAEGDIWWPSTEPCWDCTQGCAGTACPAGAQCVTIPGQAGSDCQGYMCDASAGWSYLTTAGQRAPVCKRQKTVQPPTGTVPSAPTVTATTVAGSPSLSWTAVSGADGYRIYRQLEWQAAAEVWYTKTTATSYQDGSTMVTGYPQRFAPAGQWAAYYVVALNGTLESAPSRTYYYSYSGTAPY